MPLSTLVTHPVTNTRKIAWVSAAVGLIFFLLFITITLIITVQKRAQNHNQLASHMQSNILSLLNEVKTTLDPLNALSLAPCRTINSELTSRAAFANNIRAILLVNNGIAYCSSATGAFSLAVSTFTPQTDLDKDLDLTLIPGTPKVPDRPALVFWLKQPGSGRTGIMTTLNITLSPYMLLASQRQEIKGMALVVGDKALTSWTDRMILAAELPGKSLRTINVPGYPLTLYLYGNVLPKGDIHTLLLAGLLLAVLVSSSSFVLLTLRPRPGKEILLGIKRGEFHVEYQPLIEAATGESYGLEALMRWAHPTAGNIPPDTFISYAEGKNMIIPLTRHLFQLVAQDAHKLHQVVPVGTKMGINISPAHLSSSNFRDDVSNWIKAMPANHFSYVFEITERTMVSERNACEIFDWIHQQGIKIAIDDFGTGHSALIYLEKFKFDYLKIDRGFVQSIGMETVTSPVLDAVLNLAKKLNLSTVAEGVETDEQASWLVKRGVTHMQGYLFARPMAVSQLIAYFQTRQTVLS